MSVVFLARMLEETRGSCLAIVARSFSRRNLSLIIIVNTVPDLLYFTLTAQLLPCSQLQVLYFYDSILLAPICGLRGSMSLVNG